MNAKISEIFQSVQGEGPYVGVAQTFVRFWGCNLNCIWCDTAKAVKAGTSFRVYTRDQLLAKVLPLARKSHSVSLTGGEPLLQTEFLNEFLPLLRKEGIRIYLETNGICFKDLAVILPKVDIISMDIKLPTSARNRPFWIEHREFLRTARRREVFVKAVIAPRTKTGDIIRMTRLIRDIDSGIPLILQPESQRPGAVRKCLVYQKCCLKYLRDVRVVPQVHRILKVK